MIRAMDRFYAKHPRTAFAIAVLAAFLLMYIARDWDKSDSAALRFQLWSTTQRSAT